MTLLEKCIEYESKLEDLLDEVLGGNDFEVRMSPLGFMLPSMILCTIYLKDKVIFMKSLEEEGINDDVLRGVVVETAMGTRVPEW